MWGLLYKVNVDSAARREEQLRWSLAASACAPCLVFFLNDVLLGAANSICQR